MANKRVTRAKTKISQTRGEQNIEWIERYCRVPEGGLVGQPVVLREWQKHELRRIYDNPAGTRRAIISFGRKNGKGLALDTPIPTPRGWTTIGELRAGDEVFGADGKPTKVEFVSPVHVGLKCWRLTFSDGSTVVADEQHRWLTTHSYRPWANPRISARGYGGRPHTEVVTTPQIAETVYRQRRDGGREHNHKIACAPALETDATALPIDPYVLGAWLGNGTSAAGTLTYGDADLAEVSGYLAQGLAAAVRVVRYGQRAATITTGGSGFQAALRAHGLLENKHIPEPYLAAGTEQRWALLQGLMDSDGTVNKHAGKTTARPTYSGTKEQLCRGVWRLARSLGLKATFREGTAKLYGRTIGPAYEVSFPATKAQPVFRLRRKQACLPDLMGRRSQTLTIVSCEPVSSVPTVCIKVAAPDCLFLAGHGCIPTHNTALAAFLLLLHLCGPEARANSHLFSAAQSREQAGILFGLASKIVRLSAALDAVVVIRETAKELHCPELGTLYRALSAEATTAFGLSPVFCVHDELGQCRGPRSRLYEALETATGAQEDPLSVIISTQAPTDADLLSVLIDDGIAAHDPRVVVSLHSAPMEMEPFSEAAIKAANPAFGDFLNATEVLGMAHDAERMPSRQAEYENLILNRRVEASAPFISRSLWQTCDAAPLPIEDYPVYGGLDLSSAQDLTALVLGARVDGIWQIHPAFWLPATGLAAKARVDRVPYDVWHRDGHLLTAPGKSVDYEYVAEYLRGVFDRYEVRKIAFDRWGWRHLRPWLLKAGFTEAQLDEHFVEYGQGFQDMSPALRALEAEILNGRIAHGDHPVLKMNMANAVVKSDPAGNRKLAKDRSAGRIDGAVALAMLCGVAPLEDAQEIDIRAMIV